MEKRLKVVWLCHFSNQEIKEKLVPEHDVKESAPWIPMAIQTIENYSHFEIHVVAPYFGIREVREFELRGVRYHFFPFLTKRPYKLFYNRLYRWDYISNFKEERKSIRAIIYSINPDVIHLFGAENPDYSSAILDVYDKYPCILTVQGFASNSPALKGVNKRRAIIEQKIIKNLSTAFYESKVQAVNIKKYNPNISLFWHFYGSYEIKRPVAKGNELYDLVFFARIERDKGIVDLLDAVKILTFKWPEISLVVIGSGRISEFQEYSKQIGIEKNVIWAGFQPTRNDVHRLASQARISVLPTYHDINPGTIIESMFMEIPVVSYKIGTNLEINETIECLKLVDIGDINQLAKAIGELLTNEDYRKELAKRAHKRAYEMYAPSIDTSRQCLIDGYMNAIKLFNTNE